MLNTDFLYSSVKTFQDKRRPIMDTYEKRIRELKGTEGSLFYTEESKKAASQRDAALATLKREASDKMNAAIKLMRSKNHARTIAAPTEEELRTIQALKLRENITEDELTQIANSVSDNPICIGIVQEIARNNGIHKNYSSLCGNTLTIEAADRIINELVSTLNDFMEHDTTKASRHLAERQEALYGNINTPLRKRELFDTKEACFENMGIGSEELKALCAAVD